MVWSHITLTFDLICSHDTNIILLFIRPQKYCGGSIIFVWLLAVIFKSVTFITFSLFLILRSLFGHVKWASIYILFHFFNALRILNSFQLLNGEKGIERRDAYLRGKGVSVEMCIWGGRVCVEMCLGEMSVRRNAYLVGKGVRVDPRSCVGMYFNPKLVYILRLLT